MASAPQDRGLCPSGTAPLITTIILLNAGQSDTCPLMNSVQPQSLSSGDNGQAPGPLLRAGLWKWLLSWIGTSVWATGPGWTAGREAQELPRPGARSCSSDLWRTGALSPCSWERPEIHPCHWDSHHGWRRPQRGEELDTAAWVSEVGGGGRPGQTDSAAVSPHLTPIFLSYCQGLPTRRLPALRPSPLSGPPACSRVRAAPRPGPCARQEPPGTMRANVSRRLSRLCKCQRPGRIPCAAARPPPPERG